MHCSLYFDDTNLAPHLLELDSCKRLRQDVRDLFLRARELQLDLATVHAFTDEMKFSIDVLTAIM